MLRKIGKRSLKTLQHKTPDEDLDALTSLVKRVAKRPIVMAEVGSWVGESAAALLRGLDEAESDGMLHCVDTWKGSPNDRIGRVASMYGPQVFQTFLSNSINDIKAGNIATHCGYSVGVAARLNALGLKFDLIFIDAGHTYEECLEDIDAWLPMLKPGGIICGHDYWDSFPGVVQAVDERFGGVESLGVSVWAWRKPHERKI